ncbi:Domain of uncharacterised function (DUF2825) [Klebsiella variicola]|nr:Domain of uncharacterised function (DUF2825) [Klebsiella variicola]
MTWWQNTRPVYPRWRGEHQVYSTLSLSYSGLSPLARGTLFSFLEQVKSLRFIPAGAGNTPRCSTDPRPLTVYPRWRGEHSPVATDTEALGGLSPLARGTRRRRYSVPLQSRFIPAGAGNTHTCCSYGAHHSVYPRWRGEHSSPSCNGVRSTGLSPLARGTRCSGSNGSVECRFIPAGAGNTIHIKRIRRIISVYPRWRGEHTKKIDFNINSF